MISDNLVNLSCRERLVSIFAVLTGDIITNNKRKAIEEIFNCLEGIDDVEDIKSLKPNSTITSLFADSAVYCVLKQRKW